MRKPIPYKKPNEKKKPKDENNTEKQAKTEDNNLEILKILKKGQEIGIINYEIKEAETSPPNRYNSGSIILAMENAGKLIEEEELREQIKGAGIGTSATRAEIIKKLERIKYIEINSKTQIITPTLKGEKIYDIVYNSMSDMLNPKLTASWEKGLDMVAKKEIQPEIKEEVNKPLQSSVNNEPPVQEQKTTPKAEEKPLKEITKDSPASNIAPTMFSSYLFYFNLYFLSHTAKSRNLRLFLFPHPHFAPPFHLQKYCFSLSPNILPTKKTQHTHIQHFTP